MRLLRIATAFLTASSSSRAVRTSSAFALHTSSSSGGSSSSLLSRQTFISTLLTTTIAAAASSTTSAAAASQGEGECNDTEKVTQNMQTQMVDLEYPGTAVQRLNSVHERVKVIANDNSLNGPWEEARRRILWAGGLRDLPTAQPGQGYTGHSFNDWNHVDLTTMNDDSSDNLNNGSVKGIAVGNLLGPGVRIASLPELGPGGSWSTCAMGCNVEPPNDVAHVQFRSRIAFKLVWVPNAEFDTFVLVDDGGKLLARGTPSDGPVRLPQRREREMNYQIVKGSKYATAAEEVAKESSS